MDRLQVKHRSGKGKLTVVEDYWFRTHFPNQRLGARFANELKAEEKKKKV